MTPPAEPLTHPRAERVRDPAHGDLLEAALVGDAEF